VTKHHKWCKLTSVENIRRAFDVREEKAFATPENFSVKFYSNYNISRQTKPLRPVEDFLLGTTGGGSATPPV